MVTERIFYETETQEMPHSKEYAKRKKEYCKLYEKLNDTLDERQQKMLDELFGLSGGVQDEAEYLFYKRGLRTGLLLVFEVLKPESDEFES